MSVLKSCGANKYIPICRNVLELL